MAAWAVMAAARFPARTRRRWTARPATWPVTWLKTWWPPISQTRCEVQLAYAIGVAEPVSVNVNTFGTGRLPEERKVELVRAHFPLTPKGMIDHLKLRRPIYRQTAAFGHFGRTEEPLAGKLPTRRQRCAREPAEWP